VEGPSEQVVYWNNCRHPKDNTHPLAPKGRNEPEGLENLTWKEAARSTVTMRGTSLTGPREGRRGGGLKRKFPGRGNSEVCASQVRRTRIETSLGGGKERWKEVSQREGRGDFKKGDFNESRGETDMRHGKGEKSCILHWGKKVLKEVGSMKGKPAWKFHAKRGNSIAGGSRERENRSRKRKGAV